MKRKKILLYTPWIYSRGGNERLILEVVKRLGKKHAITIMTHVYDPKNTFKEFSSLQVISLGKQRVIKKRMLSRGLFFSLQLMKTKLPLKKYDLLLLYGAGIVEMITFRNHSKPIIYYCNSPLRVLHDRSLRGMMMRESYRNPFSRLSFIISTLVYGVLERMAWKNIGKIICLTKTVRERITKAGLRKENEVTVIYPGIDTRYFTPLPIFKKYFLVPGRINKTKRQHLAVQAFIEAKKNSVMEDFKLILVGHSTEKDKSYVASIKRLASTHSAIILKTSVDDASLKNLYQNSYGVIFTAINEDFGFIPLEAGACGKPVISVNEGGPRETIIDGKTGYLVGASKEAIAEKMIHLAKNENLTKKMGSLGRKRALVFSWEQHVRQLEEFLGK